MKSILNGICAAAVLLCACATAQEAAPQPATSATPATQQSPAAVQAVPPGSTQANGVPRIAPGSVIPVQLTKSIDVKKLKTGDEVDAKVTEDLKAGNGEIVVPKDTKVVGRVTEAQARSKEQKESQVGIVFDHAVMKGGGDMNLPMSVQAIISQSYLSGGNGGGGAEGEGQPSSAQSPMSPGSGGRAGGMGTPQSSIPSSGASSGTSEEPSATKARQPITRQPINGETQGVLGFENLKLSTTADAKQGSVVSSEKNNVKLESGTLMLLRVNQ